LTFPHIETINAKPNSNQLFQSMKFFGVIKSIAAAPIRPITAGLSAERSV